MSSTQPENYKALQQNQNALAIQPKMILVDLDGTLIDTAPDLAYSIDLMMQHLGLPARDETAVREWIGNGVPRLVRRALVGAYQGEPDEELYNRAYPVFLDFYEKNVCVVFLVCFSRPVFSLCFNGSVLSLRLSESMNI